MTQAELAATMPDRKARRRRRHERQVAAVPLPRRRLADERRGALRRPDRSSRYSRGNPARPRARRDRRRPRGRATSRTCSGGPSRARAPTRPNPFGAGHVVVHDVRRAHVRDGAADRRALRRRADARRPGGVGHRRRQPPAHRLRQLHRPPAARARRRRGSSPGRALRVDAPQLHRRHVRPGRRHDLPGRGDRPDARDEPRRRHAPAPRRGRLGGLARGGRGQPADAAHRGRRDAPEHRSAARWGIADPAAQLAKQAELLQRNWNRMAVDDGGRRDRGHRALPLVHGPQLRRRPLRDVRAGRRDAPGVPTWEALPSFG